MAIKLTRVQLRRIINEALNDLSGNFAIVEGLVETFHDELREAFPYNHDDPSMGDEEAWITQIDGACMQFENDVSDLVDKIVNRLIEGEYHT